MNKTDKKEFVDYLSEFFLWGLGFAMFIYLGYRTLHFLGFTFAEEDQIYSYLGLFSTTIGAVIFAVSFKRSKYFDRRPVSKGGQVWRENAFKKAISGSMMVVCALGELGLAFADMSLVTAQRGGAVTMTEGELITYMWLTAGLAAAVGGAVAAIKLRDPSPKTDPIIDMSDLDANNDGILDSRQTTPARVFAPETDNLISDETKRLYAPGTHFIDGTVSPEDRNDPFWQGKYSQEERPAEIPFRKNGNGR